MSRHADCTVAASATSHRSTSCMNPVGEDMNIARRVFLCRKSLEFMIIGCPWRTGVLREVCLVAACRSQSRVLADVFRAHSACHGIRDLSNPTGPQRVGLVFGGLRMPGHTRSGVMTPRQGRTLPSDAKRMPGRTRFGVMTPRQGRTTSIRRETHAETYATQHFSNGYQPTTRPTNQPTRRITARRWFNARRGMWGRSSLRGQTNR